MPPDHEQSRLDRCQSAIGYEFQKVEFLRTALTHTSGADTRASSNERMEFLGDSVLGLVVSEQLYEKFPAHQEGDLSKIKSIIVSRKICAKLSEQLELGQFLVLGKGMEGPIQANMHADVFEALIGAIFLDGGWEVARDYVLKHITPEIDNAAREAAGGNAKARLQQTAQREYSVTPRYVILDEQGPDHNKCFKIAAEIAGHQYPPAWGKNKKEAENAAALNALAEMDGAAE